MRFVAFSLFIFGLLFQQTASANSLGVEPLYLEVAPGQSAALRVSNASDKIQSVEIYVHERDVDVNGIQERIPADDDFIIFPPQAAVGPGKTQVFRLQSLPQETDTSKSYFVTVRQLPVDFEPTEDGGAFLQVVFAFDAAVHVIPRGAKPDTKATAATMTEMSIQRPTGEYELDEDSGENIEIIETLTVPAVEVALENSGKKFQYIQHLDFNVSGKAPDGSAADFPDWSVQEIIDSVPVVLIEPGMSRNVTLPLPENFKASDLSVSVKQRPER